MSTIEPLHVHCDTCGATPGLDCTTPSGKFAPWHQDRRANANVIQRHMKYIEKIDGE